MTGGSLTDSATAGTPTGRQRRRRPSPADPAVPWAGAVLAPLIARAVDRLPAIRLFAGIVPDAIAGTVLTAAGNTLHLPGLPTDPVLAAGSPVLAEAVERLAVGV